MSIFTNIPKARLQRATFDLSHDRKLSMNLGQLTPVLVQEVVPGDKFNISTQSMVRLAPLIAPVMHRMNASIHYFYVPNRLIMEDWEEFITGVPGHTIPTTKFQFAKNGSLADHMGLPGIEILLSDPDEQISTLPFRAYWAIWNEYYRDVNLQLELDIFGMDNMIFQGDTHMKPFTRAWEKDYFTSALPTPQRGEPVNMDTRVTYLENPYMYDASADINDSLMLKGIVPGTGTARYVKGESASDIISTEFVNIESVTVDVEELRRATKLQRFLERSMRAGTRYAEHLRAYWNISPQDARLQRPEYIGGGKTPVVISDVANTTGTPDAPQGNLSGAGLAVGSSNSAYIDVKEHGYIIGIMSVIPETAYHQGLPKHYSRKLQLDYYFPDFAQLGEQPVLNKELYFGIDQTKNNETFGYQSRFAEYKYGQNTVHGKFRSDLEFWHMSRKFSSPPNLNADFIQAKFINSDPDDPWRIFAVTEEGAEQLWIQLHHRIKATRPMPFLNEPSIL